MSGPAHSACDGSGDALVGGPDIVGLIDELVARIIDELDYIREVARRKTWRQRSPAASQTPTRNTPQLPALAGCMPPARRANHRMVAIRGPWIEGIGETHEA